jgi:tetratricopeptide (TPR) repeat protein
MLKPKKKISKRELKQDTLVTTYMKVQTFYDKYKKAISIGVTATAVVVIATVVFVKNRADNNERAVVQLAAVHQLYDNGQFQMAIDGVPERNVVGLKAIVDNFGSTPTGDLARFYLADAYFQLGKYQEALEQFQDCSPSDDLLNASRLAGIAACYEALGNHKEAGSYFERAAAKDQTEGSVAEHLHYAARNYAEAGDKERALDLFRRIKKNHPTTTYGREADRYITQLSV